jgi:diguanylate cyclase (GGDEF)-like protein
MNGKLVNIVETGKDITQEKFLEDEIKKISLYDILTNLPNRSLFVEEVSNYLERAKVEKKNAAILIIDLNKFSYINSTYGYDIGDKYLINFANKLKKIFRKGDVISRIGNDEFGILLEDLADKKHILLVLEKIKEEFSKPIKINGNSFIISYNIGIAIFPDDGEDAETLLKQADIALSSAKREGENEYKFYENIMNKKASEFLILKKNMVEALKNENFIINYQPYFDTLTKEVKGFEALLRWKAGQEIIPPSKFIPILEETGLIIDVERWLVKEICLQIEKWKSKGYEPVPISINISPVSFKKENILENLAKIVEKHKVEPNLIAFEITENSFIDNFENAVKTLKKIKEKGFKIAIDDFGTGYSSLSYLRNIPADILKIDISFIRDIVEDPHDLAIVETIINLSKNLGLKTVAEGVETKDQLYLLQRINCDMVQGYLLSKPTTADEIEKFLKEPSLLKNVL